MNCKECGGKTRVVWTLRQPGGVRRLRKCRDCGVTAYSGEVWLAVLPPPKPKPIYTKEEIALANKKVVAARRKNEDRRKHED